jgi:CPA2 family monovalent cation:H+ antiporter-2
MGLALAAALLGGVIARRLRQPVILGYLLAGIAIGPFGLRLVRDLEQVQALATIGVILLLFALGLEFSLGEFKRIGKIATLGGVIQILATIGLGVVIARLFGWSLPEAIGFGFLISISSTVIVLKLLMERGELDSLHGRIMVGFLIVQDLAVVPMMVFLPVLGEAGNVLPALGIATLKAVVFLGATLLVGIWVIPRLMGRVAGIRSKELFLLFVITLCLGVAYAAYLFGLSPAIGAFIAGLMISQSGFVHQALGDITPVRDIFATLFFVSIGMLIDPRFVAENALTVVIIVLAIVLVKFILFPAITWLFGYSVKTALLVGAGMIQISEFSFIMAREGVEAGVFSEYLYSLILASAIITMVLTPFTMSLASSLYPRLSQVKGIRQLVAGHIEPDLINRSELCDHVVICGHGRVGSNLAKVLSQLDFSYVVIDLDPKVISELRARGVSCIYGGACNYEVLSQAGLARAQVLVLAIPDPIEAKLAMENALRINPKLDIVARVHHDFELELFRELGASELVQPELEASFEVIRHTLHRLGLRSRQIQELIDSIRVES